MRKKILSSLATAALLVSVSASAYTDFSPSNASALTSDTVNTLLETIAVGGAQRAYQPASSLGILGFDIGIEVTAISLPASFQSAMSVATGQSQSQIPGLVPLPRLNVHKGLPFALDVGLSYTGYEDIFKSIGADLKWTFFKALGLDLAAQFTGDYTQLWFIGSHAYTLDAIASMNLILIEPYLGFGMMSWEGDLDVPTNGPGSLPQNVAAHDSGTTAHVFVGVPLKLLLIHITPQYDYGFSGVSTYGLKLSLAF